MISSLMASQLLGVSLRATRNTTKVVLGVTAGQVRHNSSSNTDVKHRNVPNITFG